MSATLAVSLITGCSSGNSNTISKTASSTTTSGKSSASQSKSSSAASNNSSGSSSAETSGDYVYAKIAVPYADFYYGELNNVEPESDPASLAPQLDKEDAVEQVGFRKEGFYDAVSSPTIDKAERFTSVNTAVEGEKSEYFGPKEVNVAISKKLYEEAQKAIQDKKESKNKLLEFVEEIKATDDKEPVEYKVINSDGVLSKTIGKVEKNADATAEITTTSAYGNYEITINGVEIDPEVMQGAIIETSDGERFGLKHLDNLWLKANEISFSAKEFTDMNHNAPKEYERFKDIPGKTITKVTYMLANTDDVEIDTSLYCKELAPDSYKLSGDETVSYSNKGTKVNYKLETGDQKYAFERAVYRKMNVEASIDSKKDGVLVLPKECTPGNYQLIFSNDKYSDLSFMCLVESGLKAGDFSFKDNKLSLKKNSKGIDIATYLGSITSAKVGEIEFRGGRGRMFGGTVFNDDGSIKLDAAYNSDSGSEPVFTGSDTYKVTLTADGYPDVEFEVKAK